MKASLSRWLLLSLVISPALWAADKNQADVQALNERLKKLERVLDSQTLVDMQLNMDRMQQDLGALRGEVEQLNYSLQSLQQQQRDLYQDLDRRLRQLERGEQNPPALSGSAGAGETTTDDAGEQAAYQKAFDLLKALRYGPAIEAFSAYLKQYPQGNSAAIAQYWLAEAHYAQRQFEQALVAYRVLVESYAESTKVAEAMLKMGYCYHELGKKKEGLTILNALKSKYPDSTESSQADRLIEQLQ